MTGVQTCALPIYDPVTLFGGLREIKGIERLLDNAVNDRILSFIKCDNPNEMRSIIFMVILEDVLFRLTEVESFPFEIGVYEFERYCLNLYNALVKAYRVS